MHTNEIWSVTSRTATAITLAVAGLVTTCALPNARTSAVPVQVSATFADSAWDDGMAVVMVFRGKVKRYGVWRDAEVRDYLVREYLEPADMTKRDRPSPDAIPVLKVNRLTEFATGTYDYRLMSSLFFHRADDTLVKGVGTCQNGCGIVFQRYDGASRELTTDSYWEHEGRMNATQEIIGARFADELPFVAHALPHGSELTVLPPLAAPKSSIHRHTAMPTPKVEAVESVETVGIGDACIACVAGVPETLTATDATTTFVPSHVLRVERDGAITRLVERDGSIAAEFEYDAGGFLVAWRIRDEQEFRRSGEFRGPYWERTSAADRQSMERR